MTMGEVWITTQGEETKSKKAPTPFSWMNNRSLISSAPIFWTSYQKVRPYSQARILLSKHMQKERLLKALRLL